MRQGVDSLAQRLEHWTFDQEVLGSNPVGVESFSAMPYFSSLRLSCRKNIKTEYRLSMLGLCLCYLYHNPYLPSGPYQMDKSISSFRVVWCTFSFLFYFYRNSCIKQTV